ncbi:MAG: hypothetical protein GXO78_00140 [Calditrichaeota bacterium]|nr:hypothetical protein [Calditrichota bacterium]
MKIFPFSILLLIFCFSYLFSQLHKENEFRLSILLTVSADEDLQSEILSYLTREFRSIPDVEIVEENPDWIISVVASKLMLKNGYIAGIAISVSYIQMPNKKLKYAINRALYPINNEDKSVLYLLNKSILFFLNLYVKNLTYFHHHELLLVPLEDLKQICQKFVAEFDGEYLEPQRKRFYEDQQNSKKSNSGLDIDFDFFELDTLLHSPNK